MLVWIYIIPPLEIHFFFKNFAEVLIIISLNIVTLTFLTFSETHLKMQELSSLFSYLFLNIYIIFISLINSELFTNTTFQFNIYLFRGNPNENDFSTIDFALYIFISNCSSFIPTYIVFNSFHNQLSFLNICILNLRQIASCKLSKINLCWFSLDICVALYSFMCYVILVCRLIFSGMYFCSVLLFKLLFICFFLSFLHDSLLHFSIW